MSNLHDDKHFMKQYTKPSSGYIPPKPTMISTITDILILIALVGVLGYSLYLFLSILAGI